MSTLRTVFSGFAALALLAGFCPGLAHAGSADASNGSATPVGQTLAKLHHENVIEIREGQLARVNGQSEAVQSFGKMLVEEHGKADKKLLDLAARKRVDIATPPGEKGTPPVRDAQVERLDGLEGRAFDRAFAKAMVRDHEHALDVAKQLEKKTEDAEVRELVEDFVPMQKKHLEKARDLRSQVTGGGGTQSSASKQ